jgi:hypothetical protein
LNEPGPRGGRATGDDTVAEHGDAASVVDVDAHARDVAQLHPAGLRGPRTDSMDQNFSYLYIRPFSKISVFRVTISTPKEELVQD